MPSTTRIIDEVDGIQTFTGKYVNIKNISKNDIDILDIAHALSHQCRFAGHCKFFYSVAQHCVYGAEYLFSKDAHFLSLKERAERALCFLIHDASEAYLVDVPRPIKHLLPEYIVYEKKVQSAVIRSFDLGLQYDRYLNDIHEIDNRMLATEKRDIISGDYVWACLKKFSPIDTFTIRPAKPEEVKMRFLMIFESYMKIRNDSK